jgi:hypothetical protein
MIRVTKEHLHGRYPIPHPGSPPPPGP